MSTKKAQARAEHEQNKESMIDKYMYFPEVVEATMTGRISTLELDDLVPFKNHLFRPYSNERLDDLVESIKKSGVITPIIVRKMDDEHKYEIISGHNRVNASKLAGKIDIPAIILSDVPDNVATSYVISSNVLQRSFSEMSHSEKATVLAMHHSELFSPGKRTDIELETRRLESLETGANKKSETFCDNGKKLRSNELVGEKYSLSPAQVSRYLRIQALIQPLKDLLDEGVIGFTPAVEISFLSEKYQEKIAEHLHQKRGTLDGRKAKMLRAFYLVKELDDDKILRILTGTLIPKPPKAIKKTPVTISPAICEKYSLSDKKPEEVEKIIEAALDAYFNNEGSA